MHAELKNPGSGRIESIDLLRGIIMVIMAIDHVRDFFYYGAFTVDPTNLTTTTPSLFFTRFITHYCAPNFVFLAGTAAFLFGENKTSKDLSRFLLTRGLWLIFFEIAIMPWLWFANSSYQLIGLQVIWAIGFSMIILSGLIYLPAKTIAIFGLILVFAHDLLNGIRMEGNDFVSILWYTLHQLNFVVLSPERAVAILYPLVPWIGVMALGYCFGQLYSRSFDAAVRKKWLLRLGLGSIALFIILRLINVYGDPFPWNTQKDSLFTFLSFINVSKYPPSLDFLLITLGPGFLFLYVFENSKNILTGFFVVFGRVPFFYYFLHFFVIHSFAFLLLAIRGQDLKIMVINLNSFGNEQFKGYGYSLGIMYAIWLGIVLLLYPFCRMYMKYKAAHKDNKWLSYI